MTTQDVLLEHFDSWPELQQMVANEQVARYGSRYTEYRRHFEQAGRFEYEPTFPLYLMLEQSYICNLRCPMCIQGLPDSRNLFTMTERRMPWELYEKIILEGEEQGCPSVSVHVNDEPLLIQDLPKRIAFAREHGFMDVFMTTNGVLFTEEKVREVIDAGVTHILFSVDAATKETYDTVRIGGDWDKVLSAIAMVRNYRATRESSLPLVRASFVQSSLNQHETLAFVDKFSKLVDFVEIQGYSHYYDKTTHLIPTGSDPVTDFTCNQPWRNLIVRSDGSVLPCCAFYGYEMTVGNIQKTSLSKIFNSPRMKKLRADFRDGIYQDPACQSCSKSFWKPAV